MPVPSSRPSLKALTLAVATTTAGLSLNAQASQGNIADTYGLMPLDVGSAQGFSMFNSNVAATYYNPAYLVKDPRAELTGGIFHGRHELEASGPDRNGDVLSDSPTQHVLAGFKANAMALTRFDHPVYIGVMAGIEKFSRELLSFNSETSSQGQFFQYDRQPLFLNIGGGTTLWRGLSGGFATRITLHNEAALTTSTSLGGQTQYEKLSVEAKPSIRSILSANLDWEETFCPDRSCWLDGFETAITYRATSSTRTKVYANTSIPGLLPPNQPLEFTISTLDSFQPSILSLAFQYRSRNWRAALTVEQQNWTDLEEEFEGDSIRDQANIQFKDIIVPRLAAQYQLGSLGFIAGVAWQESALGSDSTLDVNYFDNDKIIAGVGFTMDINNPSFFSFPIQLGIAYQYQHLMERDFTISTSDPDATNNGVEVSTQGSVDMLNGSVTFKF